MTAETPERSKQSKALNDHNRYESCHECGRIVSFDECCWEEDDNGRIYCRDCWTEKNSCGCSD